MRKVLRSPWKGIGSSMVVNHDGEVVLTGPFGQNTDTIMYVEVQHEPRPDVAACVASMFVLLHVYCQFL